MKKIVIASVLMLVMGVFSTGFAGTKKKVLFNTEDLEESFNVVEVFPAKGSFITLGSHNNDGDKLFGVELEKSSKGFFGRGFEGYIKDIKVGVDFTGRKKPIKASEIKAVEYINGMIDELEHPVIYLKHTNGHLAITVKEKQ